MDKAEETFYETAAVEIATASVVPGLYAKAFSDADGDEKRAAARYIKLRVKQLRAESLEAERAASRRERAEQRAKRADSGARKRQPRNPQHESEARRLYDHALRMRYQKNDRGRAFAVLSAIIDRFPATTAADDARRELAGDGERHT